MSVRLSEIASLVRSKNAGPYMITVDIMMSTEDDYETAKRSKAMSKESCAKALGVAAELLQIFHVDPARAIKISFPRPTVAGAVDDTDLFGCHWHAPLVNIDLSSDGELVA